ncbi:MAG: acyl-CoA dehydrogenase family protein [Actinobacteria bacterium]|nr:acyl-CoA dehydrogenase family protein [Actinomycetota bacterium]
MTISERQFREEALDFLSANTVPRQAEKTGWGEGSDRVGLFPDKTLEEDLAEVAEARDWRRRVYDAGFGWITGPPEYGGRGLPTSYQRIWAELEARFDTPSQVPFGIGLGMVAPTILAHGTEAAKQRYLPAMYRGDVVACQLFSEPAAGSDLASLQTKAVRDGDEWLITGQKVWTSGAQFSDIGEIICRSDPDLPKHRGLTGFVVDMKAAGVDIRPLRQMTGGASFNEVFFDEVRVPDDQRLGDVNQGWTVALTTLLNERAAIGAGAGLGNRFWQMRRLIDLLRFLGKAEDPILRQQLADLWISFAVARYTSQRAMAKIDQGQLPGPELSAAKLALTDNLTKLSKFVSDALGARLIADTGEWGTYAWAEYVLGTPGMRIAGGTDEVMKNIIGERVLGLPKEPRPAP